MTAAPPKTGRTRQGWLALLLSLLIHAGLLLALAFAPTRLPSLRSGFLAIDPRVRNAGPEVSLFLADLDEPVRLPKAPQEIVPPEASERSSPTVVPMPTSQPVVPVLERPSAERTIAPPGSETSTEPAGNVTRASFSGTSAAGGGPGEVRTTFFQVPARGQSIVYVLDRSASMGLRQLLDRAKRELLASLNRLAPDVQFQVVAYNRMVEVLSLGGRTDLVPATAENKREAARLLEALVAEGGTEHVPALRRALALRPDVIYFLTDAGDLKPEQVRALTLANRDRSAIHTIVLRAETEDAPLRTLARENRGEYQAVSAQP